MSEIFFYSEKKSYETYLKYIIKNMSKTLRHAQPSDKESRSPGSFAQILKKRIETLHYLEEQNPQTLLQSSSSVWAVFWPCILHFP